MQQVSSGTILTDQDAGSPAANRRSGAVVEVRPCALLWGQERSAYHLVRMCDSCAQSNGDSMTVQHIERVTKKDGNSSRTRDDEGKREKIVSSRRHRANTHPLINIDSTPKPSQIRASCCEDLFVLNLKWQGHDPSSPPFRNIQY